MTTTPPIKPYCGVLSCDDLAVVRTPNPFAEMPHDAKEIDLCREHDGDFWPTKADRARLKTCSCGWPTRRGAGRCRSCVIALSAV